MASTKFDDLSWEFKPLALELVARCMEAGICVKIICTRRTLEEHQQNVKNKVSWTKHSRHIDGDAFDIAPVELLKIPDWAPEHLKWQAMGAIAKGIGGITWGGDWHRKDMCHFELKAARRIPAIQAV